LIEPVEFQHKKNIYNKSTEKLKMMDELPYSYIDSDQKNHIKKGMSSMDIG
jgi:hypothetical protein